MKPIFRLVKWFCFLVGGLAVLALGGFFLAPVLFGLQYVIVLSGSMIPAMPVGGIIMVREAVPEEIILGDVITYWHPYDPEVLVTHRVMEFTLDENGGPAFQTKGDANEEQDGYVVPFGNLGGKAIFAIPHMGKTKDFVKTLPGFLLLFALPGGLLLVNEVVTLVRSSDRRRQILQRRRRKRA